MDVVYYLFHETLYITIPLLLVALGGMFSERSGVVNIALEGIMVIGAFTGIYSMNLMQKTMAGQDVLFLSIIIAGVSGMLISLLHAFASVNMKADQVISGTAINFFAPAAVIFIARLATGTQQIDFLSQFLISEIPLLSKIPVIGDLFFKQVYLTTYLGFIILIISAFVLYKTKFGLRLRACGEHPHAADAAGVNIYKIRYAGVLLSGLLAGIGGLIFVIPNSTNFNASVAGYGFLALAVLIFGQWKPKKILFAAFFFGFMKALAAGHIVIGFLEKLKIPSYFYSMLPFVATLVVLSFTSVKAQGPRAAGEAYDKGKR